LPKPEISKAVVTELVQEAKIPDLIIETSTITPQVAQELDAICQPHHVHFVDAAIASGVASMAAGENTFFGRCEPADGSQGPPGLGRHGRGHHAPGASGHRHGCESRDQRRGACVDGSVDRSRCHGHQARLANADASGYPAAARGPHSSIDASCPGAHYAG